ncbi:MAG: hypothetical protein QOE63_510 [Acidimicrobiaceae bacterium]
MRRLVWILLLAGVVVLGTAQPASADPAKPGDYKSIITGVEPATSVVHVQVIGGDSFLQVQVDRGHELLVYAYSATAPNGVGEPFLRIRADGGVDENQQSNYTYSIETRYGTLPPSNLDPSGPPQWKQVASDGAFAWHDHRIHWMSPIRKPGIKPGDVVQDWTVPMSIDGQPLTARGYLVLAHPIQAWLWFVAAAVIAVVAIVAGKRKSTFVAGVALTLASAVALYVGEGEHKVVPTRAGGTILVVLLPGIALIAAIVALVLHKRAIGVIASLLSVATLAGWTIMRIAVLTKPVLPTSLSYNVDRAGTALAIGVAIAAAVLAVSSGGLIPKLPDLADDEDE